MLYCEDCQRLIPPGETECTDCGEPLREARENDPVLFLTVPGMQAMLAEPLLEASGIPFSKVGELGAAFTMRAGGLLEMFRFYVPYGALAQAHDLIAGTFGEDPIMMEGLLR